MMKALNLNRYPSTLISSSFLSPPLENTEEDQETGPEEASRTPLVVLPYIIGVSEDIRWECRWLETRLKEHKGV